MIKTRARTVRPEGRLYSTKIGITTLGRTEARINKHKSKRKLNEKPRVSKEMACEAVDYLLSH